MSISYKDMRIHPMAEGSICNEVHNHITYMNQNHENVWLKSHTDHAHLTYHRRHSSWIYVPPLFFSVTLCLFIVEGLKLKCIYTHGWGLVFYWLCFQVDSIMFLKNSKLNNWADLMQGPNANGIERVGCNTLKYSWDVCTSCTCYLYVLEFYLKSNSKEPKYNTSIN